jgi:Flp pilus assembly secretin CpaC
MNAKPMLLLLAVFCLSSIASGAEPKSTAAPDSATRSAGRPSTSLKAAIEQIRVATKTLEAIRSARDGAVQNNGGVQSKGSAAGAGDAEAYKELRGQIAELQNAASRLQPRDNVKLLVRVRILEMTGKSVVAFKQRMLLPGGKLAEPTLTEAKAKELIERLRNAGGLKLLAAPTIVTMMGQPANVRSGGEFPILIPNEKGRCDVVWRDIGVRCSAVAVPAEEAGKLDLSVQTQVSEKDFSSPVSNEHGLGVPSITTHSLDTQVKLSYDETLILGGLLEEGDGQSGKTKDTPAESAVVYLVTVSRASAANSTGPTGPTP